MSKMQTSPNVYAVVLAAGSASRFGSTKQLAEIDGQSLVQRAMQTANDVCGNHSMLIVGHDQQAVAASCRDTQGFIAVNDDHAHGLGTSLAAAVRSLRHVADAIIVLLADQPLVSPQHVESLASTWSGSENEIVATAFAETVGPPVLFPSACFDALEALTGDAGGRHLFEDPRFQLRTIEFEAAAIDIDTPQDLTQISRNARN